jgi:SAM-dependent methyltransferase
MTEDTIWRLMVTETLNGLSLNDVVGGGDPKAVGALSREVVEAVGAITPRSKVLDIGCGCGRSAAAMASFLRPPAQFVGVDIIPDLINFCRREITSRHPNFNFFALRQESEQYQSFINRDSPTQWIDSLSALDDDFDLVIAFSLFTHLDAVAATSMLDMVWRRLREGGYAVLSFFVLNPFSRRSILAGQSNVFRNINPQEEVVIDDFNGANSAVGFDEAALLDLISRGRFGRPRSIHYGTWSCATGLHYQDILVLRKDPPLPEHFDPAAYLTANPDVRAAGMNPHFHYHLYGRQEGRPLRP